LSHLKPFYHDFFFVSGHNTARSSLTVTNRQNNAASTGYTGTDARASAQTQSEVSDAGNRFRSRVARDLLLCEAGVHPSMAMTPEDRDLADRTPAVPERSLSTLFGGSSRNERPQSRERNILCINKEAQPYAPRSPGKSGLVFTFSDTVLLEDICETFHLFFNEKSTEQIRYLGTYTKVPIVHATVEKEEWLSLPGGVSGIFSTFFSPPPCLSGCF
jgi:hypothetical protein